MSALKSKKSGLLLILLTGILISWGVYECKYYYSQWSDYRQRPWAYNKDKNARLLVGKWEGVFKDPDLVNKTIRMEIFVPLTQEEREAKAAKRWKRGSFSNRYKQSFEGLATVTSRLGREEYEIYGAVEKNDFHKLHLSFRSDEKKKRVLPNFALSEGKNGRWADDDLSVTFTFSYQRADGSAYSSSGDPRYDKTVTVNLKRIK